MVALILVTPITWGAWVVAGWAGAAWILGTLGLILAANRLGVMDRSYEMRALRNRVARVRRRNEAMIADSVELEIDVDALLQWQLDNDVLDTFIEEQRRGEHGVALFFVYVAFTLGLFVWRQGRPPLTSVLWSASSLAIMLTILGVNRWDVGRSVVAPARRALERRRISLAEARPSAWSEAE